MLRSIQSAILFGSLVVSTPSLAQTQNVCDIVLQSKAFDVSQDSLTIKTAFDKKEELCRNEYDSAEDFRSAASSSGFDLGFKGLSLGASGGETTSTGKKTFRSEAFCMANQDQFAQEYASNNFRQVASIAVKAWETCVLATNRNDIWMQYQVPADGSGMTGTIYRSFVRGKYEPLRLTGMQVQGSDLTDSDVKCTAGNRTFTPSFFDNNTSIVFQTSSSNVSCVKPDDKTVQVAFDTDQGALPWVVLSSAGEIRNADIAALAQQVSELQASTDQRFTTMIGDVQNQITPLNAATQSLQLEQSVLNQKQSTTEGRLSETGALSLLGQVQAQATCTAMANNANRLYWWVQAVPRECSSSASSCQEICAAMPQVNGASGARGVAAALHIYGDPASSAAGTPGLMSHIYMPSDHNRRFCGPNVCCCVQR